MSFFFCLKNSIVFVLWKKKNLGMFFKEGDKLRQKKKKKSLEWR